MPTDETLSARLADAEHQFDFARDGSEPYWSELRDDVVTMIREVMCEAAAYIATRERAVAQPEVADLLKRADNLSKITPGPGVHIDLKVWAADLEAHASALVALAEARAKLEGVEGLPEKWRPSLYEQGVVIKDQFADSIRGVERRARERCADELTAALRGTDSQRPGNSAFHRPLTGTEEARESPWLVRGDALRGEGG